MHHRWLSINYLSIICSVFIINLSIFRTSLFPNSQFLQITLWNSCSNCSYNYELPQLRPSVKTLREETSMVASGLTLNLVLTSCVPAAGSTALHWWGMESWDLTVGVWNLWAAAPLQCPDIAEILGNPSGKAYHAHASCGCHLNSSLPRHAPRAMRGPKTEDTAKIDVAVAIVYDWCLSNSSSVLE